MLHRRGFFKEQELQIVDPVDGFTTPQGSEDGDDHASVEILCGEGIEHT